MRFPRIGAPLSLLTFLATLYPAANAMDKGEWTLDLNGASWHSERNYTYQGETSRYNQSNLGLGVTYAAHDNVDVKAGFFENSYDKTTLYAGIVLHQDFKSADNQWILSPGFALLLASGYDDTPENTPAITPLGAFTLSAGHRVLRVTLGYAPFGEVDVVTAQLQYQFNAW